jgi:hypothetical protein
VGQEALDERVPRHEPRTPTDRLQQGHGSSVDRDRDRFPCFDAIEQRSRVVSKLA